MTWVEQHYYTTTTLAAFRTRKEGGNMFRRDHCPLPSGGRQFLELGLLILSNKASAIYLATDDDSANGDGRSKVTLERLFFSTFARPHVYRV